MTMNARMDTSQKADMGSRSGLGRWLPLGVLAALMALALAMGWHHYLSFKTIGLNYEALKAFIGQHFVLALAAYVAAYVAVVALSLPGGLVMTLLGGFLFGWLVGAPAAVAGATMGATILFLVARTSLGEGLVKKAGPFVARLADGFAKDAFNYLLFLRLVPAFPFWLVNLAPALLGVKLPTYVAATFIGILPATTVFSVIGAGLGSVLDAQKTAYDACVAGGGKACSVSLSPGDLVTPQLLAGLAALGLLALVPVVIKRLRRAPNGEPGPA
jgi:uncharacterized membrane protein YdjX (TVP38/TMEM64 family)